jgi:hypothetical protein
MRVLERAGPVDSTVGTRADTLTRLTNAQYPSKVLAVMERVRPRLNPEAGSQIMIDLYRNPAPALHCLSSCYVLPRFWNFWPPFRRQTSNPDREGYDGERKKAVLD